MGCNAPVALHFQFAAPRRLPLRQGLHLQQSSTALVLHFGLIWAYAGLGDCCRALMLGTHALQGRHQGGPREPRTPPSPGTSIGHLCGTGRGAVELLRDLAPVGPNWSRLCNLGWARAVGDAVAQEQPPRAGPARWLRDRSGSAQLAPAKLSCRTGKWHQPPHTPDTHPTPPECCNGRRRSEEGGPEMGIPPQQASN